MCDDMWYVAEDPSQPGAAYAAHHDDPKYKKDTAKFVSTYVKKGANVTRVNCETAKAMLRRWKRPEEKEPTHESN